MLFALVLGPLVAAIVVLLFAPGRRSAAWAAGLVALTSFGWLLTEFGSVANGHILRQSVSWLPQLGLTLGFRLDGLAWLFAALITGIGALIILYGAWYLSDEDPIPRFYAYLLAFMGAMLGVVLSDNLILLAVFWELTSVSSFLLIGYWTHRDDARGGARMALTITGLGGLALLGGALLLSHIAGSASLDVVLSPGSGITTHPLYLPALILILLGAFTKSAQFPFHFWLPHAMAAPTPVSAYLHSATMVKLGVFLLARLYPALSGTPEWFWIVTVVGFVTFALGAVIALFKHDLKGLLAYSTISHLGLITMLFGLDQPTAVVAGVFHIMNHAVFKAGLFMVAGIVDHETGTRDMRKLNGLMRVMPITGGLAMVVAAGMAGLPLFSGFLSKEMFFAELVGGSGVEKHVGDLGAILLPAAVTSATLFSVAYSVRFIHDVFFRGEPAVLDRHPHDPPLFMWLPLALLAALCLVVGVAPAWSALRILEAAATASLDGFSGPFPGLHLAIWHGVNLPLCMSIAAVLGGLGLYFGLQRYVNLHSTSGLPRGARDFFVASVHKLTAAARWATGHLENGQLQRYLLLAFLAVAAVLGLPLLTDPWLLTGPRGTPATLAFTTVWLLGIVATVATLQAYRRRLLALVLMGVVGLVVSLAFVALSAPDLALTQLLVEMVTIMLMMMALRRLPTESPVLRTPARWARDAVVAGSAGVLMAVLAWALLTRPTIDVGSVAPYYLETTVAQGGGANAVNVIIVDYRGFDTMGEITVLGIAGLLIFSLLSSFRPSAPLATPSGPPSLMLALLSRLLIPLAAVVALFLYFRGHNQPGGGFAAGLVMAIALIVLEAGHGQSWIARRAGLDFRPWIGAGLLIAGFTGVGSWLVGSPFLTSTYDYPWVPGIGGVALASAALFDLGVFCTVVGATVLALFAISRLSAPTEPAEEPRP
ncbi:MAG: monovalent cation/H+ antiporter subunit A [Myxococcales bacterium]|nr:monovalent cation/H+ antiporter subunit A [Myxococcales bacterium]